MKIAYFKYTYSEPMTYLCSLFEVSDHNTFYKLAFLNTITATSTFYATKQKHFCNDCVKCMPGESWCVPAYVWVGESPVVALVVGEGVVHTGAVVQNDAVVRVHWVAQRCLSCRHPCRQTLDH